MIAIYCRISKDRKNQVSTEVQAEKGIEYANKLNLNYKLYIDKGYSGTTNNRPQLIQLIKDIEKKVIDDVWVFDQSRLERSIEVKIYLFSIIKKHNVNVHINNSLLVLDAQTESFLNIMSSVNGLFVGMTKEKVAKSIRLNVERGQVHGITPYGYVSDENKKYIIENNEAEIIKEIYRLSVNGVGTNKIAEILNDRGVLTPYNKLNGTLTTTNRNNVLRPIKTINKKDIKWSGNTIRNIIKNPFYKGIRIFNGDEYNVPSIFSAEYWQVVNDNLQRNRNNSGKVVTHNYKLKGFLTCGVCGRNYYGRTRVNLKDNFYMCSSKRFKHLNCGNRSINIKFLENLADYFIKEKQYQHIIDNASYLTKQENKIQELTELKNQLTDILKRKNNLIDAVEDGTLKSKDAKPRIELLERYEIEINNKINQELKVNNKTSYKNIINNIIIEFNKDSGVYCISFLTSFNSKVVFNYIFTKSFKFIESYVTNNENLEIGNVNLNLINIENEYLIKNNLYSKDLKNT
jgi:site-specific DNA recombinase